MACKGRTCRNTIDRNIYESVWERHIVENVAPKLLNRHKGKVNINKDINLSVLGKFVVTAILFEEEVYAYSYNYG